MTIQEAETEYHRARALVQDAMRRQDVSALEVAVDLYKQALTAIKVADAVRIAAVLSTAVDKAPMSSSPEARHGAA